MISIIIPTHNEEKYIGPALSYLTAGISMPHEIIVTDDASTDQTTAIARQFPAVTLLTTDIKHPSIAANRNHAAVVSTGEFLVFCDGDSRIQNLDASLKRLVKNFENDSELVAVTGALRVQPADETLADRLVYLIFNWVHLFKNNILHSGEASGKFQMIRRSAFQQVGGFREDLITREDADMFIRLSKIGKTRYDGSVIIHHSGRRAHRIGWPRLLYIWMSETLHLAVFKKNIAKEWKPIR